jgi:hypothetical protein
MRKLLFYLLLVILTQSHAQFTPDSTFWFHQLPLINKYLENGTLCTDSLMRIIPTDTVVDDFFGFDAGQMHSGSLVWLFKPKQNRDSLFVAFRIKAKCKVLADKLKKDKPYVFTVYQKLWVRAGTSLAGKPHSKYTISCSPNGDGLFLIVKKHAVENAIK